MCFNISLLEQANILQRYLLCTFLCYKMVLEVYTQHFLKTCMIENADYGSRCRDNTASHHVISAKTITAVLLQYTFETLHLYRNYIEKSMQYYKTEHTQHEISSCTWILQSAQCCTYQQYHLYALNWQNIQKFFSRTNYNRNLHLFLSRLYTKFSSFTS